MKMKIVMDVMHTQFQKNRKGMESIVHLAGDDNDDCDLIWFRGG